MDKDTSAGKDNWLRNQEDRGRIGYCYRLLKIGLKIVSFQINKKNRISF